MKTAVADLSGGERLQFRLHANGELRGAPLFDWKP